MTAANWGSLLTALSPLAFVPSLYVGWKAAEWLHKQTRREAR